MNENTQPTTAPAVKITETQPASIVADLIKTMPEPTASAKQTPAEAAPSPEAKAPLRDSNGVAFDPSRHAVDAKGLPKKDIVGRFYSNKIGKRGLVAAPKQTSFIPEEPSTPSPAALSEGQPVTPGQTPRNVGEVVDNATAETIIGLIQMVLVLIGEEEGVLSDTEKALIRPPLLRVLSKYSIGADVMPAEVELILALVAVLVEKIKKGGKTATWFAKAKAWAVAFFFKRQGAQIGREVRREVPANLVASLSAEVEKLKAERDAARAATQEAAA